MVRPRNRVSSPTRVQRRSRQARLSPAPAVSADLVATVQRRLLETISSAEERRRSPAGVADMFGRLFRKLTKVGGIAVYLRDEQTREMRGLAEAGGPQGPLAEQWKGVLERIERGGRVVTSNPLLVYPMKQIGRLDGLLVVQNGQPGKLSDRAIVGLLDAVSPWLAVALDHARLAQKYAQKVIRIQCLEEVSDLLNSILDRDEKLRRALETSLRLVDGEAGALFLAESAGHRLTAAVVAGDQASAAKGIRSGIAESVMRDGKSMLVKDARLDPRVGESNGWGGALSCSNRGIGPGPRRHQKPGSLGSREQTREQAVQQLGPSWNSPACPTNWLWRWTTPASAAQSRNRSAHRRSGGMNRIISWPSSIATSFIFGRKKI
ncbi:MAG: hypothetical protein KatS3mg082_1349 [Nitrospiraceae bacterium]|nr:MAG: hypothetical protein KatS3mg082_1349 [Nitrospiraceae bacterium]